MSCLESEHYDMQCVTCLNGNVIHQLLFLTVCQLWLCQIQSLPAPCGNAPACFVHKCKLYQVSWKIITHVSYPGAETHLCKYIYIYNGNDI